MRSFDRFNESSRRAYTLMRQMSRHSSRRQTANQLSFTFLHCLTWSWGGRRFHLYRCLLKLLRWIMYVCLYLHLTLPAYLIHVYQVSSATRCGLSCVSLNEDTLAEARSQGRNLYDKTREGARFSSRVGRLLMSTRRLFCRFTTRTLNTGAREYKRHTSIF